jgi:hypothetical protein
MTTIVKTSQHDDELVLAVLESAGSRGASHEDFVEAGLARDYVSGLRRLVDDRGLDIQVGFTTGSARWTLGSGDASGRQAA